MRQRPAQLTWILEVNRSLTLPAQLESWSMTDNVNGDLSPPATNAASEAPIVAAVNAGMPSAASQSPIPDDIFCQHCGYNLKMLTGDRCPECGESIAGARALQSQIPWVYRNEPGSATLPGSANATSSADEVGSAKILFAPVASPLNKGGHRGVLRGTRVFFPIAANWWRVYWKTVWMVMFRRRQLAQEMARPVSYRDAQLFRLTTIAFVCGAAILASLSFLLMHAKCPSSDPGILFFWEHPPVSAMLHVLGALFLLAATGVPSYFFHPRALSVKQQNRAVSLSYYAVAPLALPVAFVLFAFPLLFDTKILLETFFQFASIVVAIVLIALWTSSVRLRSTSDGAKRTLLRTFVQSLATCLLLPWVLLWIVASDRVFVWAAGGLIILTATLLWWVNLIFLARRTMPQRRRRAGYVTIFVPLLWLLSGLLIFAALPAACFFVWIVFTSLI